MKKLCPNLITEDVICNNDSFIEAIVKNSDILLSYLELYEQHKESSTRVRKNTDLYKMNCSVQEKLEKLCELMNKASKINIKVDQGLTNMMASLKCKQALLTDIVASYQYLINEIKVSGVIGKLKKTVSTSFNISIDKQKKIERGNDSIYHWN